MSANEAAFTVRRHPRARRVRIRVSALDGVVVTLPTRAPDAAAAEAVRGRSEWIRDALERVADARAELLAGADALLPEVVRFEATGESWRVELTPRGGAARLRESGGALRVSSADAEGALRALRRWLTRAARSRLEAMLLSEAGEHDCEPGALTVRCQRSRWGSRSSRGTLSLNRNLVFLPAEAVRSVILHELAHARHQDHSRAFWAHLAAMDPAYARSRAFLRDAGDVVPAWALVP